MEQTSLRMLHIRVAMEQTSFRGLPVRVVMEQTSLHGLTVRVAMEQTSFYGLPVRVTILPFIKDGLVVVRTIMEISFILVMAMVKDGVKQGRSDSATPAVHAPNQHHIPEDKMDSYTT